MTFCIIIPREGKVSSSLSLDLLPFRFLVSISLSLLSPFLSRLRLCRELSMGLLRLGKVFDFRDIKDSGTCFFYMCMYIAVFGVLDA